MLEVQDVKETKEALVWLVKAGSAIKKELADGFQPSDLLALGKPLMEIKEAMVGAGEIPAELKDLSVSECIELVEAALVELKLEGKQALIVKKSLVLLVGAVDLFKTIKE